MFFHRRTGGRILVTAALIGAAGLAVHAELPDWLAHTPAGNRLIGALYRTESTPRGPVETRRTPADAQAQLQQLSGNDSELLLARARIAEEQLDFATAERQWQQYAASLTDRGAGQLSLADFHHRQLHVSQEVEALALAARADDPPADRFKPANERRSWQLFERIQTTVAEQRLGDAVAERELRGWIDRYPTERRPYQRLLTLLVDAGRNADLESALADYQRAFPDDEATVIRSRAGLALRQGRPGDALTIYDRAFRPLWSEALVSTYFDVLRDTHNLRAFLDRARADIAARPDDLLPVARVFFYYQQAGNVTAAEQALADFESRRDRSPRTADELFTLAHLYERTRNLNEALRYYATIYRLPGATDGDVERALASVIDILLTSPEQPLRLGSGDLSFYRDIATLDQGPGFLNGIWSLLFNSESPSYRFASTELQASPYFRRARAAELLTTFNERFPAAARRAALNAALVSAYAAYGESDAVIRSGRRFLETFADAPQRSTVSLLMADGYARLNQTAEEFAIYNALLTELGERAEHVPLGAALNADADNGTREASDADSDHDSDSDVSDEPDDDRGDERAAPHARSVEYARVLDRYVARLVAGGQLNAALAVYRTEITRNPDDPGIYNETTQFLERHNFTAETEQLYRQAIRQFPERSWYQRLARWYLRLDRDADFAALTRELVGTFDGTDLERYFDAVVSDASITAQMNRQLNLYAQQRFPHDRRFVRNLLDSYRGTRDDASYETLLRQHWFEDESLRDEWFGWLSSRNRFDAEMAAVRASLPAGNDVSQFARTQPVSARFVVEGQIWRSRFEEAAGLMNAISGEFPADVVLGERAASLDRSLSHRDGAALAQATAITERLSRAVPRSADALTTLGEIYADHNRFEEARSAWNRLPAIEPGVSSAYLDTATVFWDYYQYDDALRVIGEARRTFGNPALFAYEAGAIYEGLRQPDRAVDEYARGALAEPESAARSRLLTLARRDRFRAAIDRLTAAAVEGATPSSTAVQLRVAVLEAQRRPADLEQFLSGLLTRTTSLELMTDIGTTAERLGFEAVRTQSVERQIAVMDDPIDKLELRRSLVRLYESREQLDLARRTLDAIYSEHSNVLGIVRSTVDYYWRHELRREAIDVLTRAADAAYPALRVQFLVEAAQKANQSADYARARQILNPLLAADPFNADYLATMASSYALAHQDAQLRDFYRASIDAMRAAPLPAEERTRRIAGLRRGLIPSLERLGDHAGAVDQYIEIINRYPDDGSVLQEAGRYASRHARTTQLVAYYEKTSTDSPRDYHWPMLLAQLQTQFEHYPEAIQAYARASAVRPDRVDFFTARGGLEERLMQFDAAAASFEKAYELSYKAPEWMLKIAELRARQGRTDDVVRALRAALIDGRPDGPEPYYEAAERLNGWNMVDAARTLADEGLRRAGADGLMKGGAIYVTVHARLRDDRALLDHLLAARAAARPTESGDVSWAQTALAGQMNVLGTVVATYYTPEERVAFAELLDQRRTGLRRADVEGWLLPLAERAGLIDRATQWHGELMATGATADSHRDRYIDLQTSRMQFTELAQAMEARRTTGERRYDDLRVAAEAYRKAGDNDNELRVRRLIPEGVRGADLRYFTLLLERDPAALMTLAGTRNDSVANAAADFILERGTADQAMAAIRARGRGMPIVWNNAYAALVGLHFGRYDTTTDTAFRQLLGGATVADRLKPVDRTRALAGDVWYQYGSRYGEYLTYARRVDSDGYLQSEVEHTPARTDAYVALADFYRDRSVLASALANYDRATTLNARRSDIHLRAAAILWRQGQRDAAIERWKQAMELLAAPPTRGGADPSPLVAALDSIGGRRLLTSLREPADRMLRAYFARNGAYRADALLRSAYRAASDPQAGTDWLIDLLRVAPNQIDALALAAGATWLPDSQRDQFYARIETVAEAAVAASQGDALVGATAALNRWRVQRIRSLIDTRQFDTAARLMASLPASFWFADRVTFEARLAAAGTSFDTWLASYAQDVDVDSKLEDLRNAATNLRQRGDTAHAQSIMELVYTRQVGQEPVLPSALLGLAELRVRQNNVPAALELLHRLTVAVEPPFGHLADAAALLERLNRPSDALEFRRARLQAVPWDSAAAIALSRTEAAAALPRADATARLSALADDRRETYSQRVAAARAFTAIGGRLTRTPVTELDWLRAPDSLSPQSTSQPYYVAARTTAAERAADAATRARLLREAVAIRPDDREVRIATFRAEHALGHNATAVEAVQPLLQRNRNLNGFGLSAAERSRLARELADTYERLDQLADSARLFRIALEGQSRTARVPIQQQLDRVNAETTRRATNASRRPQVTDGVEQPRLVRPRIAAAAAPARGGAQ